MVSERAEATPPRQRLSRRLALTYGSLLLLVLAAVLLLVSQMQGRLVSEQLQTELQQGQAVFARALEQNRQQLTQAAKVLASDYGFREAIASRDQATIDSALRNQRGRINADIAFAASLDGGMLADSRLAVDEREQDNGRADTATTSQFPFPVLLQDARRAGAASAIISIDNQAYQLVVVTVKAPLPVAVVAMGFLIDAAVASDLQKLTGLQVSFLGRQPDRNGTLRWRAQASTLTAEMATALAEQLSPTPAADMQTLVLTEQSYASLVVPLSAADGDEIAVLQRSLALALAPHRQLQQYLLGLGLAALVLALIATVLLARSIVRPLQQLQTAAQRMAAGDYQHDALVHPHDEIGDLAEAFNTMRATIANREQQILTLAYRDPLTQLPNRTYFTEQLTACLQAEPGMARCAVLLLDLERFKLVNNTLGHALGDVLLRAAGERLQQVLPDRALLARVGADEFAVLLPDGDGNDAKQLAERLLQVMQQPFAAGTQSVDLGLSLGYAVAPDDGQQTSVLLRAVEVALYYSRQRRQPIVRFDAGLQPFRAEHLSLLGDLRRAMAENQLRLFYQPKVNLQGEGHNHCEALIRWQHPSRGFVPPIEFIPFAEQTGDIKRLTRWILEQALQQISAWRHEGNDIHVAVNISAQDLLDESLRTFLEERLDQTGVPAANLGLEVTESGFIDEPERAMALLGQLRRLGLQLAIDDFGTGYSSLAYLKKLPVQELKIDQAFVRSLRAEGDDAAIIRSTIELGHNLGLRVVAEGIESGEQAALLRQWGCDRGQGYHFSRPVPAPDFLRWLHETSLQPG